MNYFPAIAILALMLSACFSDDQNLKPFAGDYAINQLPILSGEPSTSIRVGQAYEFTPQANDPDGDALAFRVANKPSWASFDKATGRLWGTPQDADVGVNVDINISVTDGKQSAVLPQFAITVDQIAAGSVTLSWYPPTQNADGSALTDLAGYRIHYGRDVDSLNQVITLNNPGLTTLFIDDLASATWHFSMTSFNSSGSESERSPTVSKTIG
ncbi:MAG: putative Ig domain-containing protein [Steroidobacteraceae bacterium]